MAAIFRADALAAIRKFLRDNIRYAIYHIPDGTPSGTFYRSEIQSVILADDRIEISFMIQGPATGTIDGVYLFTEDDIMWVYKQEAISKAEVSAGYLYKFHFTVGENEG